MDDDEKEIAEKTRIMDLNEEVCFHTRRPSFVASIYSSYIICSIHGTILRILCMSCSIVNLHTL